MDTLCIGISCAPYSTHPLLNTPCAVQEVNAFIHYHYHYPLFTSCVYPPCCCLLLLATWCPPPLAAGQIVQNWSLPLLLLQAKTCWCQVVAPKLPAHDAGGVTGDGGGLAYWSWRGAGVLEVEEGSRRCRG